MNAIAIIHIAKKELGLDEETYREMLRNLTGKNSTARMDRRQLAVVVDHLVSRGFVVRHNAGRAGASAGPRPSAGRARYQDLGHRPGMARPSQLRMLEAMWRQAARTPTDEAYRRFLDARFGISDPRFISEELVTPIKAALQRMGEPKEAS